MHAHKKSCICTLACSTHSQHNKRACAQHACAVNTAVQSAYPHNCTVCTESAYSHTCTLEHDKDVKLSMEIHAAGHKRPNLRKRKNEVPMQLQMQPNMHAGMHPDQKWHAICLDCVPNHVHSLLPCVLFSMTSTRSATFSVKTRIMAMMWMMMMIWFSSSQLQVVKRI